MKKPAFYVTKISIVFLWILLFYLQFEFPFLTRAGQNISPLLLPSTLLHSLFWLSWISLPILILLFVKGRFFCYKICPVGIIQDLIPSFGKAKISRINISIFVFCFVFSFFSINLLAILDPLVIFNRATSLLKIRFIESIIFLIPLLFILLLNTFQKRFWCLKLCPLGALSDLITNRKKRKHYDIDKRRTLIALGSGLVMGSLVRWKTASPHKINSRLLRPPGALNEKQFKERCIRCGSCISICLTGTLIPTFTESGITGLFTPKLMPKLAECDEYCNKCGESCPTQAIKNLELDVKSKYKIGTSKIDKTRCIAWSNNALCLICQEFCPYLSIKIVKNADNIPCPEVIPELCRGCGHCEHNCPVELPPAIIVYNTGAGQIIKDYSPAK